MEHLRFATIWSGTRPPALIQVKGERGQWTARGCSVRASYSHRVAAVGGMREYRQSSSDRVCLAMTTAILDAKTTQFDAEDIEYLRHGDKPLLARVYKPRGEG